MEGESKEWLLALQQALLSNDLNLLTSKKQEIEEELTRLNSLEIFEIAENLIKAEFEKIIKKEENQLFFPKNLDATLQITEHLSKYSDTKEYEAQAFKIVLLGVAVFGCFKQMNWTGPELKLDIESELSKEKVINELFIEGGESVYDYIRLPHFLLLARSILSYPYSVSAHFYSVPWWATRYLFAHQIIVTFPFLHFFYFSS